MLSAAKVANLSRLIFLHLLLADSSLSLETGHPSPTLAPLRQSIMGSADLYHHDEAQLDSILLDARRSTVNSTASWNAVQSANAQVITHCQACVWIPVFASWWNWYSWI